MSNYSISRRRFLQAAAFTSAAGFTGIFPGMSFSENGKELSFDLIETLILSTQAFTWADIRIMTLIGAACQRSRIMAMTLGFLLPM